MSEKKKHKIIQKKIDEESGKKIDMRTERKRLDGKAKGETNL